MRASSHPRPSILAWRCLSPSPPRFISRTPHVEITRLIRPAGSRGHNVKQGDRPKLSSPSSHSLQQAEGAVVIAQLCVLVISLGLSRTDGLLLSASLLFLLKSASYSSGSRLFNIRLLGNSERDGRLLCDHLAITPVSPSVPKSQALHLTNPSHGWALIDSLHSFTPQKAYRFAQHLERSELFTETCGLLEIVPKTTVRNHLPAYIRYHDQLQRQQTLTPFFVSNFCLNQRLFQRSCTLASRPSL